MVESVYYCCVLWSGMVVLLLSGRILFEYVLFEVGWKVEWGICLQVLFFFDYEVVLIDIVDYCVFQELGSVMCSVGVQVFEYCLVCCLECGCNVVLFMFVVFIEKCFCNLMFWLCEIMVGYVVFKLVYVLGLLKIFFWELFLVDGKLLYLV